MSRNTLFILLLLLGAPAVAQEIFLHSHNAVSNRFAIFDDDEQMAYLYLTKPGTQQPEKDAAVYSRLPPVEYIDWDEIKKTGNVPPLTKDIVSNTAVIQHPGENEFSFRWSPNGDSVAILRNGIPLAFISMSEKHGYSKAIIKASPIANPWDQVLYDALFGK